MVTQHLISIQSYLLWCQVRVFMDEVSNIFWHINIPVWNVIILVYQLHKCQSVIWR